MSEVLLTYLIGQANTWREVCTLVSVFTGIIGAALLIFGNMEKHELSEKERNIGTTLVKISVVVLAIFAVVASVAFFMPNAQTLSEMQYTAKKSSK